MKYIFDSNCTWTVHKQALQRDFKNGNSRVPKLWSAKFTGIKLPEIQPFYNI